MTLVVWCGPGNWLGRKFNDDCLDWATGFEWQLDWNAWLAWTVGKDWTTNNFQLLSKSKLNCQTLNLSFKQKGMSAQRLSGVNLVLEHQAFRWTKKKWWFNCCQLWIYFTKTQYFVQQKQEGMMEHSCDRSLWFPVDQCIVIAMLDLGKCRCLLLVQ